MKVLVVDADRVTASAIRTGLLEAGHEVELAHDGLSGLSALRTGVDVCVLELALAKLDGLAVLDRARIEGIETPVVVLTTRGGLSDRIAGLRGGADDYMTKPFAFDELLARIEAVTRRCRTPRTRFANLEIDLAAAQARVADVTLQLTQRQFALLAFFVENADMVVTRSAVLERVFVYDGKPRSNLVDAHVANLRAKLAQHRGPRITTFRGAGYRLEQP